MANLPLKTQTACFSQSHNIIGLSLSVCHFRNLGPTICCHTVNFWKIHQLMFRHSSACAFSLIYGILGPPSGLRYTTGKTWRCHEQRRCGAACTASPLFMTTSSFATVQLVCRQHAALRVQDVCGLSVMPKHQNDRKTYRTICDSYSKITAAKTIIFLAVFRLAAFFSAVFRPKPYIFG